MSREIKFRQFYDGRMEYAGFISVHGCEVFRGFPSVNRNKYPVMQYTGLNDVNGVEVYEGDILELKPFPPMVVKFGDGSFFVTPNSHWDVKLSDSYLMKTELVVIGNMHQNPELLK